MLEHAPQPPPSGAVTRVEPAAAPRGADGPDDRSMVPATAPSLAGEAPRASTPEQGRARAERVWLHYRAWVATILLAHKPAWASVDDLLQEVALALLRRPPQSDDDLALKQWLRTVAINAARAAARSTWHQRVQRENAEDVLARLPDATTGGSALNTSPTPPTPDHSLILAQLDALDDGYREPLLLKVVHGMSYREIGRVLDLPESTIETRIARARAQLRQRFANLTQGA